jgi:teichuronic acid biosynthesis glycosyltransferase TuaG
MSNSELISVIMPAYNAEQFIKDSVNSVIAQTYTNWELIVVDDGSKDNTKEIVNDFIKIENRIKYIHQLTGKQGKARNTGIESANGDLIAFLDADDLWEPQMLEEQRKLLRKENADLVFSQIKYIDEESNFLNNFHGVPQIIYESSEGLRELIKGNSIPIITVLAKKDSILKAHAFKTSLELQYGEDYDLWLRMLLKGAKFVCHDEPLALYRKHQMQSSKLTGTKYIQLLTIIANLPSENFISEKKEAARLWLKRSMRYTKPLNRATIRKLSRFLPSYTAQYASIACSYILPVYLLRRIVFVLTDLK